jgi:hypothetical protein
MKTQKFLVAIIALVICNTVLAQEYDFRATKWGWDSLQVKKAEPAALVSSQNNSLQYDGKLGNWDARIVYDFTQSNQLCHAAYILSLNDKNPQDYVNLFLLLQNTLTNKYKEPTEQITTTINGRIIKQDEWATNLLSDNLNLETKWKTNKTAIILSLFSVNDNLCIEINYNSLDLDKKSNDEKKQQLMHDL